MMGVDFDNTPLQPLRVSLGIAAAVRANRCFDVQMGRLATGDYLVNGEALVERRTISDLATSLVDGRLFPQSHDWLIALTAH